MPYIEDENGNHILMKMEIKLNLQSLMKIYQMDSNTENLFISIMMVIWIQKTDIWLSKMESIQIMQFHSNN